MATLSRDEQDVLVTAFKGGDERAFETLYTSVEPFVRRSIFRMVSPDDLDDVVQETMIKAHQRIAQFNGESLFSTWCVSIAVNNALGQIRQTKRRSELITHSIDETFLNSEGFERKVVECGYEDRTAEQNLALITVERGLAQLNADEQLAIRMQLDGESLDTIATAIGKIVPTTKSIVQRAKVKLEKVIREGSLDGVRRCKCGCGEEIPKEGWPYQIGHAKKTRKPKQAAEELIGAIA